MRAVKYPFDSLIFRGDNDNRGVGNDVLLILIRLTRRHPKLERGQTPRRRLTLIKASPASVSLAALCLDCLRGHH